MSARTDPEPSPSQVLGLAAAPAAIMTEDEKQLLIEQAVADANRLINDPDDRAELLAIQRFLGVAE